MRIIYGDPTYNVIYLNRELYKGKRDGRTYRWRHTDRKTQRQTHRENKSDPITNRSSK